MHPGCRSPDEGHPTECRSLVSQDPGAAAFTRAENGACRRSQRRILATFGTTTPCEALRRPHGAPARRSAAFHVTLAALDPPRAST